MALLAVSASALALAEEETTAYAGLSLSSGSKPAAEAAVEEDAAADVEEFR